MGSEKKEIEAIMILEIIGFPEEHIINSLKGIVDLVRIEEGVKIIGEKISKPVLVKGQSNFYTSFAELSIKVVDMMHLAGLVFKYLPSNIEVVYPESDCLSNYEWSEILTELTRQLHKYDEVARVLDLQKSELEKKLSDLSSLMNKKSSDKKKTKKKTIKKKQK